MWKYDKIYIGILAGALMTVIGYYGIYYLNESLIGINIGARPFQGISHQFILILSVVANLIPFNFFRWKKMNYALRGVGVITILAAMGFIILKFSEGNLG